MPRTILDKYENDSVSASAAADTDWPLIPDGEEWIVTRFGARMPAAARVELQVRVSTGPAVWRTLRVIHGPGSSDSDPGVRIVGDGANKKLRMSRVEESASAQVIFAWVEGYKRP